MAGRPNWYSEHPPACTCARCNEGRRRRRDLHPVWDSALNDYELPPEPPRRRRRGFATGFFITLALAFLVAAIGFVIYDSGVLDRQTSPPALAPPAIIFPTPTSTPTGTATPVPTFTPSPTVTPTAIPTLTSSPTSTPSPTPMPTTIPAAYHIEDLYVSYVDSGADAVTVDFSISLSRSSGSGFVEVRMAIDGGEPELITIVSGLALGESRSFVFSREFAPGRYEVEFMAGDVRESVEVNVQPATVAMVLPTATPTVTPSRTPTMTPMPQATATFTPTPEPAAIPGATPTPVVRQIIRQTPTPTPTIKTLERAQQYMLELINLERENAGLNPVEMGSNRAAQLHAESSLENCVSSHWGIDGLKPYMRYSLAGGYQSNAENGRGLDYCYKASDRVRGLGDLDEEMEEAIEGWMSSPGHRRNMLDPTHRKVNIGIAWDDYNIVAIQHFEGDHVRYDSIPSIADGVLSMSGSLINDAHIADRDDLGVQIYYDPPPHPLTRGQVSRTYCYSSGVRVASLRPSLQAGWFYTDHSYTATLSSCPNPYDVPSDVPGPESANEANRAWQFAYDSSKNSTEQTMTVLWITASHWETTSDSFKIEAALGKIPSGVYTVLVWAKLGDEREPVSEYSIFYGVEPPGTYSR